jgi:glycerol uptake facilitator-like aquaporin
MALFFSEFFASFFVIFTFLIIRHNKMLTDAERRWMKYLGPILMYYAFLGCNGMIRVSSNGPLNPTIAMNVLLYSFTLYNYKLKDCQDCAEHSDTFWTEQLYGEYAWVYLVAPLLAAPIAAWLARKHIGVEYHNPDRFHRGMSFGASFHSKKAGFL